MYLLHPVIHKPEVIICQNLYWPYIKDAHPKEVTNYGTCQRTKQSNKNVKLPAKLSEEIPWNKICVDLIGTYVISTKGRVENLNIKDATMINPVTGWFEILKYDCKREITISNLVETMWLSRVPGPI